MEEEFDPSDFPPPKRTEPCRLYLISPQEVGGVFPDRLNAAVETGAVAAVELRIGKPVVKRPGALLQRCDSRRLPVEGTSMIA